MHSSKLFLEASALLLCWSLVQATPAALQTQDDYAQAQERLLFLIIPQPCSGTTSGKEGVCRSNGTCAAGGQVGDGGCGLLNLGVCCVDRASDTSTTTQSPSDSCTEQTSDIEFTFTNPSYPNVESETLGRCRATITTDNNTCQLLLDLNELNLAKPDNEGVCLDYLQVSGSTIPKICGDNARQDLYVDVTPGSNVNIDLVIPSVGERWHITVTQIACNSADIAPAGCLQYHRTIAGNIISFNYNPSSTPGTHHLADQSYGVCIEALSGYCSVTYEHYSFSRFSLSGDPTAPGTTGAPLVDGDCTTDYLLIPNSTIVDNSNFADPKPTTADRFCGLSFPKIRNAVTPFKINVVTDSDEISTGDSNNEGFSLRYKLNQC